MCDPEEGDGGSSEVFATDRGDRRELSPPLPVESDNKDSHAFVVDSNEVAQPMYQGWMAIEGSGHSIKMEICAQDTRAQIVSYRVNIVLHHLHPA